VIAITREWDREAPPEWVDRLAAHNRTADSSSWLALHWHPGYPGAGKPASDAESVERWVLYQVVPPEMTPQFFRTEGLSGWHGRPRNELQWHLLDSAQKSLWHRTGCYAMPIWCMQGAGGGQPWRYTEAERLLAAMRELPPVPVPPGELEPCPLDQRVFDALRTRDAFVRWETIGAVADMAGVALEQTEVEALRSARKQFWDWSEDRMRASVDEFSQRQLSAMADELPRVLHDRDDRRRLAHTRPDLDAQREAFLSEPLVYSH
jgi:hypothetical protein